MFLTTFDSTRIKITCTYEENELIKNHFKFFDKSKIFSWYYKQDKNFANVYLYDFEKRLLKIGLLKDLVNFLRENKISFKVEDKLKQRFKNIFDPYISENYLKSIEIYSNGNKIKPYDYQIKGVLELIKSPVKTLLSVTSSGKSLIIYLLIRLFLRYKKINKILLIVPRLNLIKQMYDDFNEYSFKDLDFITNENILKYSTSKKENDFSKKIHICNYQGISNKDKSFFNDYDIVLCDEVHKASCDSICDIVDKCSNVKYLYGFTGTLHDEKKDPISFNKVKMNFGDAVELTKYSDLMINNQISDLRIQPIMFNYNLDLNTNENYEQVPFSYLEEKEIISTYSFQRNEKILDICNDEKNTVFLVTDLVNYGNSFYQQCLETYPNKNIHFINANSTKEERESLRENINNSDNNIVIATYQLLSTGWSVKNLHKLVFLQSRKDHKEVLQSIGRILRLHHSKKYGILYDIYDKFNYNNILYKHHQHRLKSYNENKFLVRSDIMYNIDLDLKESND